MEIYDDIKNRMCSYKAGRLKYVDSVAQSDVDEYTATIGNKYKE